MAQINNIQYNSSSYKPRYARTNEKSIGPESKKDISDRIFNTITAISRTSLNSHDSTIDKIDENRIDENSIDSYITNITKDKLPITDKIKKYLSENKETFVNHVKTLVFKEAAYAYKKGMEENINYHHTEDNNKYVPGEFHEGQNNSEITGIVDMLGKKNANNTEAEKNITESLNDTDKEIINSIIKSITIAVGEEYYKKAKNYLVARHLPISEIPYPE